MTMPDSNDTPPWRGIIADKNGNPAWTGALGWTLDEDGNVKLPIEHLQNMLENSPDTYHPNVQANYLMYKSLPGWPSSFGSTNAFEVKPPQAHQYANWPMDATSAHNKIMSGLLP